MKPRVTTDWATSPLASKLDPNNNQKLYGWSTSDNQAGGRPVKPNLQHQNGWQYIVHLWIEWLNKQTSEARDLDSSETNIDWSLNTRRVVSLSSNTTYSFSNITEGQDITVRIENTSGSAIDVTFPSIVRWEGGNAVTNINANSTLIYRFTAFESGYVSAEVTVL